jgi:1-acyl-sn-glycerol-3-phosphate acyltransferase
MAGWPFFNIFNRTITFGRENVGEERNTVLLSNHQSMIDGFLVGGEVFFPKTLFKPSLFPWLPAAHENFFSNPVLAWLSDNWCCIPVKPGRKDFSAMIRMERCLRTGVMIVFPEGTRSRDGRILPPRSGIGYVMLKTKAKAIPVCMDGMDRAQPVGKFFPKMGNTILLYYGKPVDLSEFYAVEPSREAAQAAIEKVFVSIRRLQKVLYRYRRYRRHVLARAPALCRLYKI